ncbi:MAG: hypothetical protein IPL93_08345 [Actinomycetales bacterium]|nr:hypothetical protein [Actinomycetales bacterium]
MSRKSPRRPFEVADALDVRQMEADERDRVREAERAAAQAWADEVQTRLHAVPVMSPEARRLSVDYADALELVRSCRSDNSWRWARGARW